MNKLRTCTISRSIRADDLGKLRLAQSMGGGDYIIAAYRVGKCARRLFNYIFVTDGIKINEQSKSIDIGPLYLQIEFEAICRITPTESYVGFEPGGVSKAAMMVLGKCKTPKCILS